MLRMFFGKDFESNGRKRKTKRKIESMKMMIYVKILTKDGIYCTYLKWICLNKKKYYKSQDEYIGN